ncbi:MAG: PEP-CTERM sorting domain-containing protein [Armatimonadota bacterium]
MKKVIGIVLVMGLLLGITSVAMADSTNWVMKVTASKTDGTYSGVTTQFGWRSGYTDGIDTAKNELVAPPDPVTGDSLAYCVAQLGVDKSISKYDFRQSLSARSAITAATPLVWTFAIYSKGPATIDPIMLKIEPTTYAWTSDQGTGKDPLVLSFATSTGFSKTFNPSDTLSAFTFNVSGPATMTVTVAPKSATPPVNTPEPGSMLALGSGLVGLMGFAIRRRK